MSADRLFDDDGGLFELNPSKVQCYLDCPRQYRFRYVEKRPERRTFAPTALGRSVHKAMRDFYGMEPDARTVDNLLRCLRRSWDPTGYRSAKDAEEAYARAEEMLRRYHAGAEPSEIRVVALESKFAHAKSREGVLVTGRVDRIDLEGGEYVIVDYKTGRFGEHDATIDESLPLSLYAIAVSAVLGRDVSRIAVEHLPTGRRAVTRRDTTRLDGDWKSLVDLADEMRRGTLFPPRPSALCSWCDYLSVCPEGRASIRVENAPEYDIPPPDEP